MDWFSVKDKLPDWFETCLCRVIIPEYGGGMRKDFRLLRIEGLNTKRWNCEGMIVTHWMHLPKPPENE